MDIKREIKKLAKIPETDYPFLSLYLNTKWEDEKHRGKVRLFVKNEMKEAQKLVREEEKIRKSLQRDSEEIQRYVDGVIHRAYDEGVNGIAIFACSGIDTFKIFRSSIPFDNQLTISSKPSLRQLVQISDEYSTAIAVMVDTDRAKIFEISLGEIRLESQIESYVPGRHEQGGWSQMRFQRHIREHMHQHHKGVAEQLIKLFDEERFENIILIGQEHILATFKPLLPERVRGKIKGDLSAGFEEEPSSLAQKVSEYLRGEHAKKEDTLIEEITETALARGAATVGLRDTIEAINRGQVHRLALDRELKRQGWQCTKCLALGEITSLSCPFCNSAIATADLGEEMIRSVINRDGEVELVRDHPKLSKYEGVGALLRFK
ncbi:MAG: Vms1/Ankzf1 family peptidyl-tRNA hydrolase [Thermodesulfobacteriota bacterium]